MPRNLEPSFSYLTRATGDRLRKQVEANKRWAKANPERRKLTVKNFCKRKREKEKQRLERVAAYMEKINATD